MVTVVRNLGQHVLPDLDDLHIDPAQLNTIATENPGFRQRLTVYLDRLADLSHVGSYGVANKLAVASIDAGALHANRGCCTGPHDAFRCGNLKFLTRQVHPVHDPQDQWTGGISGLG